MKLLKKHWWKFILILVVIVVGVLVTTSKNKERRSTDNSSVEVTWHLEKDNSWVSTGVPPACPEPLVLEPPVDLSLATSILYPGQPRGPEYKPHGGFRFSEIPENKVTVRVPFNARVVRGLSSIRDGEPQYAFEFIAPCGISYWFGHLRELSPKFQQIVESLPSPDENSLYATLAKPVPVLVGEPIATAVGYKNTHNVFFDWGVFDLRKRNGFTIRSEWAKQFGHQFDEYAVCWLDLLPQKDSALLKSLPGGDFEYGKMSDYCIRK